MVEEYNENLLQECNDSSLENLLHIEQMHDVYLFALTNHIHVATELDY